MFKILLAEDEKNLRNILSATLKKEGYLVVPAENGAIAYDWFCKEKFDLVVTDIRRSVMDGNELTERIRNIAPDTPILRLTALETIDDKERGFLSGADDYLTKPFALKELLLRIKALLRRYGKASESKIVLTHSVLDYSTFTFAIDGKPVERTKKSFCFCSSCFPVLTSFFPESRSGMISGVLITKAMTVRWIRTSSVCAARQKTRILRLSR